jgi:transcriptional regulator with XRE-family HTH domain
MSFATHLADLRRHRGLTQAALAARAGVNVSQLRRYEAGDAEPSLSALRRLATGLSVTADTLVFQTTDRLPADTRLRLAYEATTFLDKRERDTVIALLDAFLTHHQHAHSHEGPRAPQQRRARTGPADTATRRRRRPPAF